MTIALGILASDGVVIAADTELSWGDARKTEAAKISFHRDGGVAIAGAGDDGFIEALSREIHIAIQLSDSDSLSVIGQKVQGTLAAFYRDHIMPWACALRCVRSACWALGK